MTIHQPTLSIDEIIRLGGDIEETTDITIGLHDQSPPRKRPDIGPDHGRMSLAAAVGKLVELKRRESGWSIDHLAEAAGVPMHEVVILERGDDPDVNPGVLRSVATALNLPAQSLNLLLRSNEADVIPMRQAAIRFTARASGIEELRPVERAALAEFEGLLVGK